jgi:hypothetical protein
MESRSPIMLFGKSLFGFWLPFIGFTTYIEYDNIFNPKFKMYEHVFLVQWIVGYGLVYKTEVEVMMEGEDWNDE